MTVAAETSWALDRLKQYGTNAFSTCLLYSDVAHYHCCRSDGFIGFLDSKALLVVMGEPICGPADYEHVVKEFVDFATAQRKSVVFIGVSQAFVETVRPFAPTVVRLGDDWIFDVATYAPRGDPAKKVRSASNQLKRRGGVVREFHPCRSRDGLREEIDRLVARWLAAHSRFQMHFLRLDLYHFAELKRYFYIDLGGRPIALLSCLPIFGRNGYLFEDVIRDPDAPNGCTEAMVLHAIRTFRDEGKEMATFGLSPRLAVDGMTNVSWTSRAIASVAMKAATRLSHLDKLYHARKKFHTGRSEPSYLVKLPAGIGLCAVSGIMTAFHLW